MIGINHIFVSTYTFKCDPHLDQDAYDYLQVAISHGRLMLVIVYLQGGKLNQFLSHSLLARRQGIFFSEKIFQFIISNMKAIIGTVSFFGK